MDNTSAAQSQQSQQLGNAAPAQQASNPSFDAIIQNALQAGVPPQQLLQFLQSNMQALNFHGLTAFQQQLVQQHQAAAQAAQQHQVSSATPQPHQTAQQQLAAHTLAQQHQHHLAGVQATQTSNAQHQQLQQQLAAVAAAVHASGAGTNTTQTSQTQAAAAAAAAAANAGTTVPSLAWPIFQPTVSIPYFDMATYQKVNLDVQPSAMANGMDLPLSDINTLRFFFNFGVQHARAILLRQHIQSQSGQTQSQQQMALLQAAQMAAQQQAQHQPQHQQHAGQQHDAQLLASLQQQNLLNVGKESSESSPLGMQSTAAATFAPSALRPPEALYQNINLNENSNKTYAEVVQPLMGLNNTNLANLENNSFMTTAGGGSVGGALFNNNTDYNKDPTAIIVESVINNDEKLSAQLKKELARTNLRRAQNEYLPNAGGSSGSSTHAINNPQKSASGPTGTTNGANNATDRANAAAAAVVAAAFNRDLTTSMSMNLQNSLVHQMAAKMGTATHTAQAAHYGTPAAGLAGFKPLLGGAGGGDHLEALWLQNALLGGGGVTGGGGLAAQLRAHPALHQMASQHLQGAFAGANNQQTATAVQQLLLQQQQLAAVAQQQHHAGQTAIHEAASELVRPQAINPLSSSVSMHLTGPASGVGSLNTTAGGTTAVMSSAQYNSSTHQQQSHENVSVSPKPPIPVDPAPRKASMFSPSLHAQLGEIKQLGLNALRSPEPMTESLQKSLAAVAAAMNVPLSVPLPTASGGNMAITTSVMQAARSPLVAAPSPHQRPSPAPASGHERMSQSSHHMQPAITNAGSGMPSLAAQLSAAMVAGSFMTSQANSTAPNSSAASTLTSAFPLASGGASAATRSLTSGTSGIPGTTSENSAQEFNTAGIDAASNLLAATEMHYTETFKRAQNNFQQQNIGSQNKKNPSPRPTTSTPQSVPGPVAASSAADAQRHRKSGVYMLSMDAKDEEKKKTPTTTADKPVSTTVMMNYVNNVLTTAKAQLQSQGVGLYFDESGRPVDFSSRPIDPIFRKAREHLDSQRDLTRITGTEITGTTGPISNASSDSSIHENQASTMGGDLGFLSRTSGCLIGISQKNLPGSGSVSSVTTAIEAHDGQSQPQPVPSPISAKATVKSVIGSQMRPFKRRIGQDNSGSIPIGIGDTAGMVKAIGSGFEDSEESLDVEELSPPATSANTTKAQSIVDANTAISNAVLGNMPIGSSTSSALLAAALQHHQQLQQHALGLHGSSRLDDSSQQNSMRPSNSTSDNPENICKNDDDTLEVVDSGTIARTECNDSSQNNDTQSSANTNADSSSAIASNNPKNHDDDDGDSVDGKRLRIASFSSADGEGIE